MAIMDRAAAGRRAVLARLRLMPTPTRVGAVVAAALLAAALLWGVAIQRAGDAGGAPASGAVTPFGPPPRGATSIAAGGGTLWAVGFSDRSVRRFSLASLAAAGPERTVGADGDLVAHAAAAGDSAWIAVQRGGNGLLVRLGPDRGRRVLSTGDLLPDRIAVLPARIVAVGDNRVAAFPTGRRGTPWSHPLPGAVDVAVGYGSIWTLSRLDHGRSLITRRDPATGSVVGRRAAPAAATAIAVGLGAVWVANGCRDGVLRAPVGPGPAICAPVGKGPADIAVGGGSAWAADAAGRRVVELDRRTAAVRRAWRVPGRPARLASDGGTVIAATRAGATVRIDDAGAAASPLAPAPRGL